MTSNPNMVTIQASSQVGEIFPHHPPVKDVAVAASTPTSDMAADELHGLSRSCLELQESQRNMLVRGEWPRLDEDFKQYLCGHRHEIESIISHHLSLQAHQECTLQEPSKWLRGDFNTCIPVSISNWRPKRLLIRCPFPHRLGALQSNNLLNEKVRCEAATYAWIAKNCPRTPIPCIWGFGLPDGASVCVRMSFSISIDWSVVYSHDKLAFRGAYFLSVGSSTCSQVRVSSR